MSVIRKPAVAGTFYPSDSRELKKMVTSLLKRCMVNAEDETRQYPPQAVIAPHAGYIYSGPIAGVIYALLREYAGLWKKVAVIGPAHYVYLKGIGVSSAQAFETPLGQVPLDSETIAELLKLKCVQIDDDAHYREHSVETHLPFLQTILGKFSLVPLVVGDATDQEVSKVLEVLLSQKDLLVIISSDLSHHLTYDDACELDQQTTFAIEKLNSEKISCEQACGAKPIRGLLRYARSHKLKARTLCLANSGDTAGSRDSVVGYGAYAFVQNRM